MSSDASHPSEVNASPTSPLGEAWSCLTKRTRTDARITDASTIVKDPVRQPEQREQPFDVEEEGHPGELPAAHLVHQHRPRGQPAALRVRFVLPPGEHAV